MKKVDDHSKVDKSFSALNLNLTSHQSNRDQNTIDHSQIKITESEAKEKQIEI